MDGGGACARLGRLLEWVCGKTLEKGGLISIFEHQSKSKMV